MRIYTGLVIRIFLFFISLYFSNFINACNISNNDSIWPSRKLTVRANLFNIVDPYIPAIQIGVEYSIRPKFSLYHELGYITSGISTNLDLDIEGFKFINAVKFYPFNFSKYAKHFVGLELGINKYMVQREVWVNLGAYSMAKPNKVNVAAYYTHLITGFNIHIKPWYRCSIEYYVGIGIRYRDVNSDIDTDSSEIRIFNDQYRSQSQWFPSVTYGFKIGYLIKK